MVFDRFWADLQYIRDLLSVLALGYELENFALAGCQPFEKAPPVDGSSDGRGCQRIRGNFLGQNDFLMHDTFQGRLGLLGPGFSLFGPGYSLFGPGYSLFGPGYGLFGSGFGLFGSGFGLFGSGFALFGSRLCQFGPVFSLFGACLR